MDYCELTLNLAKAKRSRNKRLFWGAIFNVLCAAGMLWYFIVNVVNVHCEECRGEAAVLFYFLLLICYAPINGFIGYLITKSVLFSVAFMVGSGVIICLPAAPFFLLAAITCSIGSLLAWIGCLIYWDFRPDKKPLSVRNLKKQLMQCGGAHPVPDIAVPPNFNFTLPFTRESELERLKYCLDNNLLSREQYDAAVEEILKKM